MAKKGWACLALVAMTGWLVAPALGSNLVKIGEYYNSTAKGWVPVHRDMSGPQPYPPPTDSWSKPDTTIWVAIASYRDPRCGQTLYNMFTKAANPARVHVGVVQQMVEGDTDCLDRYCELVAKDSGGGGGGGGAAACPYRHNVRMLRTDAAQAAGPTWGRHLQQYLLRDEEFCMQIDSHMDFVQGWETHILKEWSQTDNEHAVISTYVQSVEDLNRNINGHWEMSHLCELLWHKQVRNCAAKAMRLMTQPKLTTTWAAGFSLSKCHAVKAVPYDPYLPQIFDGEEFSMYARFFTHGYDVYTPTRTYIGHDYNGANNPNAHGWYIDTERNKRQEEHRSDVRLWTLLELPGGDSTPEGRNAVQFGPFGLGRARTLDQLMDFAGVDLRTKSYRGGAADKCGDVSYAPPSGVPPQQGGYPDNMADGPFWAYVRRALAEQGDWTAADEAALAKRLGNAAPQQGGVALAGTAAVHGGGWWAGVAVLSLATVVAARLVMAEVRSGGRGAFPMLPLVGGAGGSKRR